MEKNKQIILVIMGKKTNNKSKNNNMVTNITVYIRIYTIVIYRRTARYIQAYHNTYIITYNDNRDGSNIE